MKAKFINKSGVPFAKGTGGAAAFDLVASISEPIELRPQAPAVLIPTGIWLDMTENSGLAALVLPRSGLGHKQGLVLGNGVGLIDNDYQGEVFVSAWNRNPAAEQRGMNIAPNNERIKIEPGMRLAQLLFLNAAPVELEEVETFEKKTTRGGKGFGSTGTKSTSK